MKDKPPLTHDDVENVKQFNEEMTKLGERPDLLLNISPLAAWCLILQIQLVGRHPFNKNWVYDLTENFAHELESALELSDWLKQYTNKGWNPELDRAVDTTVMGIAIPAHDYVLNNLALGVACQMLIENNGGSLKEVTEYIQRIACDQLRQLSPTQIAETVAEFKKVEL